MTQLLQDHGTTTRQVRTLIADDEPRARQALGALLALATWVAPDHTQVSVRVIGEAANGQEALEQVSRWRPEVVIMDARMPVMDGFEATRQIKERWPVVRVIMLTMHPGGRAEALSAGADGYLLKGCSMQKLLEAIAGSGGPELSPGRDGRPPVPQLGFPAGSEEL